LAAPFVKKMKKIASSCMDRVFNLIRKFLAILIRCVWYAKEYVLEQSQDKIK